MADIKRPLRSADADGKRKGPKERPKLPLSVFTPPSSGTSDRFPVPPSPSAVHPTNVTDAHVCNLDTWRADAQSAFGAKADGVVLSADSIEAIERCILGRIPNDVPVLAISIPLPTEGAPERTTEPVVPSSVRVHYNATFKTATPAVVENVIWALNQGRVVDLYCDLGEPGKGWEALEGLIEKTLRAQVEKKGKLVLSNILPPPHSLELSLVKLLSHSTYNSYQSFIASLSLNSNVFLKFLPPAWDDSTPQAAFKNFSQEAKEWKRRVKMFIGPAIEAFGFQRIIFGSSPSPVANTTSKVGNWYEIARESFAELGIEQEDIDAIFSGNAKAVYGSS